MTTAAEMMTPRLSIAREAPDPYRAMLALDRAEDGLDPVIRELVKIRASQVNGCAYCIDMHTKDARAAGESEQRLYALTAWRETPFFTLRERAALALTEAATRPVDRPVPDDVYDEAARYFDPDEMAHLIWRIAIMNAWNRIGVTARLIPGSYQPS